LNPHPGYSYYGLQVQVNDRYCDGVEFSYCFTHR